MIEFQVLQSPDLNAVAPFKYSLNQVYIGRTSGDLWLNDPHLRPAHILLEVVGTELLVHPQRGVEYFLINGKRASAVRKIKLMDELTIGETIIKILSFKETIFETKKDLLNTKLGRLIDENSPRLAVIESLGRLMK